MVIMERSRSPTGGLRGMNHDLWLDFQCGHVLWDQGHLRLHLGNIQTTFHGANRDMVLLLHQKSLYLNSLWWFLRDNQVCPNRPWTYRNPVLLLYLHGNHRGLLWQHLDLQFKDVVWLEWCINFLHLLLRGVNRLRHGQDLLSMVRIHLHHQELLHNLVWGLHLQEHRLLDAKPYQEGITSSSSHSKLQLEPVEGYWRMWSSYSSPEQTTLPRQWKFLASKTCYRKRSLRGNYGGS